jgi:glycosyltransferase involved in cell wall biosynthesis
VRIAIVTSNPPSSFGGVERFVYYLSEILRDAGHDVDIIDRSCLSYKASILDRYVKEIRTAYYIGKAFLQNADKYDFVFVNGTNGWKIKFRQGVAVSHGTYGGIARAMREEWSWKMYIYHRYVLGLFERLSCRGRRVVAVSESAAEDLVKLYWIDRRRITVIQNAVDTDFFRPVKDAAEKKAIREKLGLPIGEKLILFTGSNIYRKGNDVLRRMGRMLPRGCRLIIATDAASQGEFGEKSLIFERVHYSNLPDLYRACDAFVFPSRYEGCSFSLIEAMACGLPFVVSCVGHAKDIIKNDPTLGSFVLQTWDPIAYVDKLLTLVNDGESSIQLGRRARDYVLTHNSYDAMRQRYLELIRQ